MNVSLHVGSKRLNAWNLLRLLVNCVVQCMLLLACLCSTRGAYARLLGVAGDYMKDSHQTQQESANSMLRFLHAPQPCNPPSRLGDVDVNAAAGVSQTLPLEGLDKDSARMSKLQHQKQQQTAACEVECKQSSDVCEMSAAHASKRQRKGPLDSFFTKR